MAPSRITPLPSPRRPPWPQLPREVVEHHRRQKFVTALAELAHEQGIAAVTAQGICRAAHSAKKTYYELFGSTEEFLRFAFAAAFEPVLEPVSRALAGDEPPQLEPVVGDLYAGIADNPALAELALLHSFGRPVESAGHDYQAALQLLLELLERCRSDRGAGRADRFTLTTELPAAWILSIASNHLHRGEAGTLPDRGKELATHIVELWE